MQQATEIHSNRGTASAALSLGSAFLHKNVPDSAARYFDSAAKIARASGNFDIETCSYSGLARAFMLKKERKNTLLFLNKGYTLLHTHSQLNHFYALLFLEDAALIYKNYKEYSLLAQTLALKSALQESTLRNNGRQYQTILMTGLRNETRILNMEIDKAQQEKSMATTKLYLALVIFLLLLAAFIAYRYYTLQKLKLAHLRNKISQDLHDEVGATLSGIALYSYIAKEQSNNHMQEQVAQSLGIIEKNATGMVKKLNDIVWVVNPAHDSLDSLLQRLEEYAVETAAAKDIKVKLVQAHQPHPIKLSMDERKNIYLISKEAINNAIKYSNCPTIHINTSIRNNQLRILIMDDGDGFDTDQKSKGNGLINMRSRAKEIKATLDIKSEPGKGTSIELLCKTTQ